MTPVYLNPLPSDFNLVDQDQHKDDHDQYLQLFLSSAAASSSSSSVSGPTTFLDTSQDHHRMIKAEESHVIYDPKQQSTTHHGGSNYDAQELSSSSIHDPPMAVNEGMVCTNGGLKLYLSKRAAGEGSESKDGSPAPSSKWISSKMRLMNKMVKPNNCIAGDDRSAKVNEINSFSSSSGSSSTTNNVRVCSDCNTTTTPLWRSGPRGPKSLCNACGIRQRKARRAMEAAAAATADSPSIKIKVVNNKEKKSRTNQRKLCFKDFALSLSKNSAFKQVLPQDVEEAAILLMELSCGFIQS